MNSVRIGAFNVGHDNPVFVIAEIGINHNGDVEIAKQLIKAASEAGAHAVKFQKRTVPIVYTPDELAKSRAVNHDVLRLAISRGVLSTEAIERLNSSNMSNSTNGDLKYALEFTASEYGQIDAYCRELEIIWFASPWDKDSVDFLEQFLPPCYKVASASLTDDDLLRHIRRMGRPIILSTGMSDMPMIEHAVDVIGKENLVILHCTSFYPTNEMKPSDHGLRLLNLKGINTLMERFGVPVGFSSHDTGIQPSYAAAAIGACVVEKHLTMYRSMWGSDQSSSIEPGQLDDLCRMLRELKIALGNGQICFYPEEKPVAEKLRRVNSQQL